MSQARNLPTPRRRSVKHSASAASSTRSIVLSINRVPPVVRFAIVGASGVLPNLFAVWLLTEVLSLHYIPAIILGAQAGVAWNFIWTDRFVFPDRRNRALWGRLWRFILVGNVDLVVRIPFTAFLVEVIGMTPVVATAIVIAAIFLVKYLLASRTIWRRTPPAISTQTV